MPREYLAALWLRAIRGAQAEPGYALCDTQM